MRRGRLKQRSEMLDALSAARLEAWRPRLEALTHNALDSLSTDRPVDLLAEFALPWGLALAMLVMRADPADSGLLADLGGRVFAATGESEDAAAPRKCGRGHRRTRTDFRKPRPLPMAEPTFVALSQALPHLLASAWLALVAPPWRVCAPSRVSGSGGKRDRGTASLLRNRSPRLPARHRRRRSRRCEHRTGRPRRAEPGIGEPRPGAVSRPRPARSRPPRHRSCRAGHRQEFLRRRHADPCSSVGGYRRAHRQVCRSTIQQCRRMAHRNEFLFSGVGVCDPAAIIGNNCNAAFFTFLSQPWNSRA